MALLLFTALFLGLNGYTSATYCVCKDGVGDTLLQKNIDYACGDGADCTPILQSGGCYQPNTVKAHCDYAVNSYFQKKAQVTGSCDFAGTALPTSTLPTTVGSGCSYPASPSQVTSGFSPTGTTTTTPTTTTGTATGAGAATTGTAYGSTTDGPTAAVNPTDNSNAGHDGDAMSMPLVVAALFSGILGVLLGAGDSM